jgi:hypothetical protein
MLKISYINFKYKIIYNKLGYLSYLGWISLKWVELGLD